MRHTALIGMLAAISLSACAAPASEAGSQDHAAHHPDARKVTSDYLKPGLDVDMQADMLTLARAGDVGTVTVDIGGAADGAMTARLSSSTGLDVLGRTERSLSSGTPLRVDVRAPEAGRHYLDIIVTGESGVRTMSVPVQVGKSTAVVGDKPSEIVIGPDGSPRRVMPASETIDGVPMQNEADTLDGE